MTVSQDVGCSGLARTSQGPSKLSKGLACEDLNEPFSQQQLSRSSWEYSPGACLGSSIWLQSAWSEVHVQNVHERRLVSTTHGFDGTANPRALTRVKSALDSDNPSLNTDKQRHNGDPTVDNDVLKGRCRGG